MPPPGGGVGAQQERIVSERRFFFLSSTMTDQASATRSTGLRSAVRRDARRIDRSNRRARLALRKFLRFFPAGFRDETYLAWERDYKEKAHISWRAELAA